MAEPLTPVKIRGKKRAPSTSLLGLQKKRRGRPLSAKSASTTPASSATSSRAGTPSTWTTSVTEDSQDLPWPSQQAQLSSRKNAATPRKKRRKTKSFMKKLSPLEQLPAEILQTIFLDSLNADLPAASPMLHHKINSDHIKMEFTFRVLYAPKDADTPPHGMGEASAKLLARRFFTWEFFQTYAERACQRSLAVEGAVEAGEAKDALAEFFQWEPTQSALESRFRAQYEERALIPEYLKIHKTAWIPEKLIKGPWDSSKASFLAFLVSQQFTGDAQDTAVTETLIEGIYDAIRCSDVQAADVLMVLLIRNSTPPSQDILRIAVVESGCDEHIVFHLLNWSFLDGSNLDYFDPVLWNWAEANKTRGSWLKDQLRWAKRFVNEQGG